MRERLEVHLPQLTISGLARSSVPGVHVVDVKERGGTFYVTDDGVHLFAGDLFVLGRDGYVNTTDIRRRQRRVKLLSRMSSGDAVVFRPATASKAIIFVFTDTDCPYCREFHGAVAELNSHGVEARYLAYPMGGRGSPSYDGMVSVWCADDRRSAMTALKRGDSIPPLLCANPVAAQMALGDEMGVRGTPTLVTERGELLQGYHSVDLLLAMLLGASGLGRTKLGDPIVGASPVH